MTEVVSGASGDDTTVAPGVALLLITDEHTTARLGTAGSGMTSTGSITVKAAHESRVLDGGESCRRRQHGSWREHRAEHRPRRDSTRSPRSPATFRGRPSTCSPRSSINSEAQADATAKGADGGDDDADKKKQDQVDNNPNTTDKDRHPADGEERRRLERRHRAGAIGQTGSKGGDTTAAALASLPRSA